MAVTGNEGGNKLHEEFDWTDYFHDKQIGQFWLKEKAIFKNYYNLNFKGKSYLIFPVLAALCVFHQIIKQIQQQGVEIRL